MNDTEPRSLARNQSTLLPADSLPRDRCRIVNAAGNFTRLGGSVPTARTLAEMSSTAAQFLSLDELQRYVHDRLASVTRNERAYVTVGAAAGLYLATWAVLSSIFDDPPHRIPFEAVRARTVIVTTETLDPYEWAIAQTGVRLLHECDLERIDQAAASAVALVHIPNRASALGAGLSFADIVDVARSRGLPLIVDAAAQVPPIESLWSFTRRGADIAIFSGSKGLRGPQASGLLVGRRPLMDWVSRIGYPNEGFGRMLKVGRDAIAGLASAVEDAVANDVRWRAEREAAVQKIVEALRADSDIEARRVVPNIAGQDVPYVDVTGPRDWPTVVAELRDGDPHVVVGMRPGDTSFEEGFIINLLAISPDDVPILTERLVSILDTSGRHRAAPDWPW